MDVQVEQKYYAQLYALADVDKDGKISGREGAAFLRKSGLNDKLLHEIWDLVDTNKQGFLLQRDFAIAMRLVSMAQQGQTPAVSQIINVTKLPQFQDVPLPSNFFNTLSEQEKYKYDNLFLQADANKDGYVDGNEAKIYFTKANVPVDKLAAIWSLAQVDKDNRLNKGEFRIAMHLIYMVLKGEPLPESVPENFVQSAMSDVSESRIRANSAPASSKTLSSTLPTQSVNHPQQPIQQSVQQPIQPVTVQQQSYTQPVYTQSVQPPTQAVYGQPYQQSTQPLYTQSVQQPTQPIYNPSTQQIPQQIYTQPIQQQPVYTQSIQQPLYSQQAQQQATLQQPFTTTQGYQVPYGQPTPPSAYQQSFVQPTQPAQVYGTQGAFTQPSVPISAFPSTAFTSTQQSYAQPVQQGLAPQSFTSTQQSFGSLSSDPFGTSFPSSSGDLMFTPAPAKHNYDQSKLIAQHTLPGASFEQRANFNNELVGALNRKRAQ